MSHTERCDVTFYNGHMVEINGNRYVEERMCCMEREIVNGMAYKKSDECFCVTDEIHPRFCPACGAKLKVVKNEYHQVIGAVVDE